jgi:hypothetical protein
MPNPNIPGKNISDLLEAFFSKRKLFLLLHSIIYILITKLCNVNIMKPVPFLLGPFFLKVLSSEMDLAEIRLIRKVVIKERGAAVL